MPFFSRNKEGKWVPIVGETPLHSRNGGTESKMLAVIAPFDDDGRVVHITIVEPDSIVIQHGPGFLQCAEGNEVVIKQEDFFIQNKTTKKITLVIYVDKRVHKQVKATRVATPQHETPDDEIYLK